MDVEDLLNEHLKQLAIIAQQHLPSAPERQLALTSLVYRILNSSQLCRPQSKQFVGVYQDIYNEAVQDLLAYVCHNINEYEPNRESVMAWVNVLLERRFFRDAISKVIDQQQIKRITLSELDNIASPTESQTSIDLIKECIELDRENLFRQECIEQKLDTNFQTLVLQRTDGKSWKEIAAKLEINVSTLTSFYSRCLAKFADKLKAYCIEDG
ncbi:sigma-70 family RNA polymerase sigma factor [Leptolyngbya sp. FACHB-671]|uniref:RNA polymerase sigma factor n=1 Tax=Leptolyngbya sp. FACHB-671 TaxID=2692812 RepID=UPI001683F591|nr:sigma-70 family RNA polymerase sigma factor [Leptolyngbya sp. FACHB-671]MBD2066319.1 sigma-70 family RNA polymerase sigma factor [Leptolyngbya sp. FACHB-671]